MSATTSVDRGKAMIAGVGVVVAVVLLGLGFVLGRATNGGDEPSGTSERSVGPADIRDGVPFGFPQTDDGAAAAVVAWLPWLWSTPQTESPGGIEAVLADGVEPLFPADSDVTVRAQFLPMAARVEMTSETEATVEIFGLEANGDIGEDLTGEYLLIPVDLQWDDSESDWRISHIQDTDVLLEAPLTADELEEFRVLRPYGSVLAGTLIEAVPGE